jgi:hypothetical protein
MPRLGARRLLFPFAEVRKRCFSVSAFRSFFQPALPLKLSYRIDDSTRTTTRRLSHSHTSNPALELSTLRLCEPHTPTALDDKCGNADMQNMSLDYCWLHIYISSRTCGSVTSHDDPLASQPAGQ